MKKLLMLASLSMMIVLGTASFADTVDNQVTKNLTIQEAISLAIDNSNELIELQSDIDSQKLDLGAAEDDADDIEANTYSSAETYVNIYLTKLYNVKEEESKLESLKRDYANKEVSIKNQIYKDYLDLKSLEEQINIAEEHYKLTLSNFENLKKQFELGQITQLTLNQSQLAVDQEAFQLDKMKQEHEISRIGLCQALGLDINTNLVLASVINAEVNITDYNIAQLNSEKTERLQLIVEANEALELQGEKWDIIEEYTDKIKWAYGRPSYYADEKEKLDDLETAYNDAVKTSEINLKSEYYSLYNNYYNYMIKDIQLKQAQSSLDADKIKYGLGMITLLDYQDSYNSYLEALEAKDNAQNTFYIDKLDFDAYTNWISTIE